MAQAPQQELEFEFQPIRFPARPLDRVNPTCVAALLRGLFLPLFWAALNLRLLKKYPKLKRTGRTGMPEVALPGGNKTVLAIPWFSRVLRTPKTFFWLITQVGPSRTPKAKAIAASAPRPGPLLIPTRQGPERREVGSRSQKILSFVNWTPH